MREPGPVTPRRDRAALRRLVQDVNARLAAQLRLRRQLAGVSQGELAGLFGVTHQQWNKYERGQNRMSAGLLLLVVGELQLDPAELVERCLEPAERPARLPKRPIDERLLDRLGELDPDQQRALSRFLATVRPEPLPGFPAEGIAL